MSEAASQLALAIDTCGETGSIALGELRAGRLCLRAEAEMAGRSYSARLLPEIWQMLEQQTLTIGDLRAIVVVHGPGSFTGIRVGLSAAKALAEAAPLQLIALSRLQVLAGSVDHPRALAILDAGRGELYAGEYENGLCVREALCSPQQVDELARLSPPDPPTIVVCEERAAQLLAGLYPVRVAPPSAGQALHLAGEQIVRGPFADVALLDGNYLRRTDAEIFSPRRAASQA